MLKDCNSPVIHDDVGLALLGQDLGHLLHLLLAILDAVDADIPDQWDTCTHGRSSTALAVLDSDTLAWLDTQLLAGVEVDLRVRLGGRRVQAGGSAVDMLVGEVLVNTGLLQASNDARLCTGADHAHRVSLLLEALQLLWHTRADLAFLAELLGDAAELLSDVVVKLFWAHGEVVLLLQPDAHAAEVLTDEVSEEGLGGVASVDVVLFHDLVGQVSAGLEGEVLAEA